MKPNESIEEKKMIGWREALAGFCISFLLLFAIYPDFILFKTTPMHATGWALQDPIVSYLNFKPCFRVFQHELYSNFNILWSSLRSMGMPILANDIQAAPLFPLTLLLSWLNEGVFWNVFILSRIFLLCLGTYLLLRRFFSFERLPSLFFILTFIFTLYVMRWMNHPWQNGFMAGVWYLYFLCEISIQSNRHKVKRYLAFLGLAISVYAMVTCGFPEASVMAAFLVVLTYIPLLISRIIKGKMVWKPYLIDLFLAHLIGFALSSYQILSLVELLSVSESYRTNVGFNQYKSSDFIPFFAEILTQFKNSAPTLFDNNRTYLGFIPLTFFFLGLGTTVKNIKRIGYGEVGALLCGAFILFKFFPFAPAWFNTLVASPPVLRDTYFFVYFFTLFLWFFSYFTAKGVQDFLAIYSTSTRGSRKAYHLVMILLPAFTLLLILAAAPLVTKASLLTLFSWEQNRNFLLLLTLFIAAILLAHIYISRAASMLARNIFALLLFGLVLAETTLTLPKSFIAWHPEHENKQLSQILTGLKEREVPLLESRIIDKMGSHVLHGLATADVGATPLLPVRTTQFRAHFFDGVFPRSVIHGPKNKVSWGITSTNIRSVDRYLGGGEAHFPNWLEYEKIEGGDIHFDVFKFNKKNLEKGKPLTVTGGFKDFFYLKGWAVGKKGVGLEETSVFIVFKDQEREISVPTKPSFRPDVARHLQDERYLKAGWETYVATSAIRSGDYSILIRFAHGDLKEYMDFDTKSTITLTATSSPEDKLFQLGLNSEKRDFLGMLGHYYVYFDQENSLPRAYTASLCKSFDTMKGVITNIYRTKVPFELGHVYIEELTGKEKELCEGLGGKTERVPILSDGGSELLLEKVQGPGVVVLNDNFYPGWEAKDLISGEKLDIKPANITFRSVVLSDSREYQLRFSYRPSWLWPARALVFSALILLLANLVITIRKNA